MPDPSIPTVTVIFPEDSTIAGDTVDFLIVASPLVEMAEFFLDDTTNPIGSTVNSPYDFSWETSGMDLGSEHYLFVRVSDSAGNFAFSDSVLIFYQWQELMSDINDPWPTDIKRILCRTTDSLLELRYEFWENWDHPYADTGLNIATYFDVDQNVNTGRTDFGGTDLNGIGAEYRMLIGFLGGDTALAYWNTSAATPFWDLLIDTTGLAYHNVPQNTNVMEIGIRWSDIDYPGTVRLVAINIFFQDTSSYLSDWVPDQGTYFMSIANDSRYTGSGFNAEGVAHKKAVNDAPIIKTRVNPFNE